MFIGAYNEAKKNVSVSIQANGSMAEWGTVFSNLAKYSFGCQVGNGNNETGVYVAKRPSQDDLRKLSAQKLTAFSKIIGNQQGKF